jgi:hypothetical protein
MPGFTRAVIKMFLIIAITNEVDGIGHSCKNFKVHAEI